jgi:hypothetical protein
MSQLSLDLKKWFVEEEQTRHDKLILNKEERVI